VVGGFHTIPITSSDLVPLAYVTLAVKEGAMGRFSLDISAATDDLNGVEFKTGTIAVEAIPDEYGLEQNYPNPFNPTTSIRFAVGSGQSQSRMTLKVYNLLGQEVAVLVDEAREPGYYTVTWDASEVATGVYFYRLVAGDFSATRRMVLMK
jgi:hypothetical protein